MYIVILYCSNFWYTTYICWCACWQRIRGRVSEKEILVEIHQHTDQNNIRSEECGDDDSRADRIIISTTKERHKSFQCLCA